MGSTLIVNGLVIFIAIYTIGLHRPVSCRRTVSASYLERTNLRIIRKCYRKCRFFQSRLRNVPQFKMPYGKNCFSRCVQRQVEKATILGAVPGKNYILLGSKDKPPENILVPARIPQLPKELYKSIDRRQWQHGDCDAFDSEKKIDVNMRKAVILDGVVITCVNKNELLVSWKQPNGLTNCTGYQVNYRLGRRGKSGGGFCFEVSKDKTALLINKEKGFQGQEEIHLAVTALPLPFKCDIKLQKYKLCPDVGRERIRRNINATPSFVILKSNDPLPTDLIMPSVVPLFPSPLIDGFSRYRQNSNCFPPPPTTSSAKYAGNVKVFDVGCIQPGNFSKKAFVVHWRQPENYLTVPFKHFQVLFSITPDNFVPKPERIGCRQVDKNTLSYRIDNVDRTSVLNVLVVPYPTYSTLNLTMQRFIPCLPTKPPTTRPSPPSEPSSEPVRVEVVVGATLTILVAIVLLALLYVYHRRRSNDTPETTVSPAKIYVSYYADSKKYHSSLLNLVAKLRRVYSVNLIMDSYCQTEMIKLGPARWCQLQLAESTRVLMVISKDFLKICRKWQSGQTDMLDLDDVNVNRVCSELQHVVNHIFEQRKNSLLTIMLVDVNQRELPDLFRGMKTFAWPENEDQEHAIVCSICSQEALVAC